MLSLSLLLIAINSFSPGAFALIPLSHPPAVFKVPVSVPFYHETPHVSTVRPWEFWGMYGAPRLEEESLEEVPQKLVKTKNVKVPALSQFPRKQLRELEATAVAPADEATQDDFKTANPGAFDFYMKYMDVIHDKDGKLQALNPENLQYWKKVALEHNKVPGTQRDNLHDYMLAHCAQEGAANIQQNLELFHWNMLRSVQDREMWWQKAQIELWRKAGYDWQGIASIGDILAFNNDKHDFKLGRTYIDRYVARFAAVMRKGGWTKGCMDKSAMISAFSKSSELGVLRGFLCDDKQSLYEMRLKQVTNRLIKRHLYMKLQSQLSDEAKVKFQQIQDIIELVLNIDLTSELPVIPQV